MLQSEITDSSPKTKAPSTALVAERAKFATQPLKGGWLQAVAGVWTFDRATDDAGVFQHLQVLRDRRLRQRQFIDEAAADASLPLREQLDDTEPRRVRDCPQQGDGLGIGI